MTTRPLLSRAWLLIVIVVITLFTRFWNLSQTLQFLGDQGRDVILVRRFLTEGDIMLIGPVTSTGNMYLGPLYYYFMAPWLWLWQYQPVGPAVGVAILSALTVVGLYWWGRQWVGEKAALMAALLAAVSHIAILYGRFSWNPNPAPIVMVGLLWSLWQARYRSPWYLLLTSTCVALLLQLHYVILLVVPVVALASLVILWRNWQHHDRASFANFGRQWCFILGGCVLIQLLFLSPLIVFDFRHNFANTQSFLSFFQKKDGGFTQVPDSNHTLRVIQQLHGRTIFLLWELLIGKSRHLNEALTVGSVGVWLVAAWHFGRKRTPGSPLTFFNGILLALLGTSIVGLAFYESSVFDHYVLFLLPVIWLLHGQTLNWLVKAPLGKYAAVALIAGYCWWNVTHWPLTPPMWTTADMQRTAESIAERVKPGEKYNLVLFSESGDIDGQNYRYFLENSAVPPVREPQRYEINTLFLINERHQAVNVLSSPVFDVVIFPNKQPADVYTVAGGPDITVLRR